jgi:HlyD family secretion protein
LHLVDPQAAPPLGHGFRVDARVVLSEQSDAVRTPTYALVRDGWAVFVVRSGRATLTPITLGDGGDDYRAVSSGLHEGDRVILLPGDSIVDGDRVQGAPRRM